MAQDIVPVQLGLTEGDVVTLWAPRWREDGEDWEAFLGHGDHLYVFPDAAQLAAFVRTVTEHDLTDHPAWRVVPQLAADELVPDETQRYDLVGVPELVAGDPDTWAVDDLGDVISMVRTLADVCDLEKVHEVLGDADGFALLGQGSTVFLGREGERLWTELATTIAQRWDEVLDAVDAVVTTPEVDAGALAEAEAELASAESAADEVSTTAQAADEDEEEPDFWQGVGIDPILITTTAGQHYTLRCYLDESPVFLGKDGTIEAFPSARALVKFIAAGGEGDTGHDLAGVSTWENVVNRATAGDLAVEVADANTYVLTGLADDLAEGPSVVDPTQLELAVELIADAGEWAGDESVTEALAQNESLGWLISYVVRPDPNRLAPNPPFTAEADAWRRLVNDFTDRLHVH
jgi:hypothetical protein